MMHCVDVRSMSLLRSAFVPDSSHLDLRRAEAFRQAQIVLPRLWQIARCVTTRTCSDIQSY